MLKSYQATNEEMILCSHHGKQQNSLHIHCEDSGLAICDCLAPGVLLIELSADCELFLMENILATLEARWLAWLVGKLEMDFGRMADIAEVRLRIAECDSLVRKYKAIFGVRYCKLWMRILIGPMQTRHRQRCGEISSKWGMLACIMRHLGMIGIDMLNDGMNALRIRAVVTPSFISKNSLVVCKGPSKACKLSIGAQSQCVQKHGFAHLQWGVLIVLQNVLLGEST